jgi:hypothetical protein
MMVENYAKYNHFGMILRRVSAADSARVPAGQVAPALIQARRLFLSPSRSDAGVFPPYAKSL